tara:strand:- start:12770 stop:13855 length:1086 start_codon:yes stop_codon:yes gene_type:complete
MKIAFLLTINGWWYDEIKISSEMKKRIYKHVKNIQDKKTLRIDYAVGYYLQYLMRNREDITIELIKPYTVVKSKQFDPKNYDLIITQFLSPLAVFQTYNKDVGDLYNQMLQKNASKVYPPVKYTAFIEDKCAYSNLLKKYKLPTPPQVCITKNEYENSTPKSEYIRYLQTKFNRLTNERYVFAKPILGTGSWGIKRIDKQNAKQIQTYLDNMFMTKKYPKVMFQPYYPDFGTTFKELRYTFIGDRHISTVTNSLTGNWSRPKQEVKTFGINVPQYHTLKKTAMYIIDNVIKPKFFDNNLPMLETRVDFGCCLKQIPGTYFINEVEYAGGVLTFMDKKHQFHIHEHFSKQLVKVIQWYEENN